VLVVGQFFYNCGRLLQETIAFVLKIFSLSDKKKVLDRQALSRRSTLQ